MAKQSELMDKAEDVADQVGFSLEASIYILFWRCYQMSPVFRFTPPMFINTGTWKWKVPTQNLIW